MPFQSREDQTPKPLLPNNALGFITFYNLMYQSRGITMTPHLTPVAMALTDQRIKKLLVVIGPGAGKEHPYSMLCPTPSGLQQWGDIQPGDFLFGVNGAPTRVIKRHEQGIKPVYRVTFDDGTSTLAGLGHLWRVRGRKQRKHGKNNWITLTTQEIIDTGLTVYEASSPTKSRKNFEIPVQGAAQFQPSSVPFDAYAVGVWLGDGSCDDGVYTKPDIEIATRLRQRGCDVVERPQPAGKAILWRVVGLKAALMELELLGLHSWERSTPSIYKFNTESIRLDILRGLLDTDGYGNPDNGTAIFTSTSKQLADDVAWLVRSVGGKALIKPKQKSFTYKGEKKPGRPSWDVSIAMPDGVAPFYLPRKQAAIRSTTQNRYLTRWITAVEYSHDEQCMCVTVEAKDHLYLCNDFIATHNSLLISVAYTAFCLGHDPSLTVLGLSAGEALPQGFMLALMELIDNNPFWEQVFPGVTPDKSKGWSTERGLFISGHSSGDPDSSYFAAGLGSKALTGKHARLINADDLHDEQNSASADACLRVRETYYRQIIGRADPRGARYIFAGRRWHEEDLYGHLKSTGEWVVMELPALRGGLNDPYHGPLYWDLFIPNGLECVFTEPDFMEGMFSKELLQSVGDVNIA